MDGTSKRTFSSYSPGELRQMFETEPDRFQELAAEAIRNACTGKTEEETVKLRQMQWVIEGQLRKQQTPRQKLQEMQRIFYDKLYGDDGLIFRLNSACTRLPKDLKERGGAGPGKRS